MASRVTTGRPGGSCWSEPRRQSEPTVPHRDGRFPQPPERPEFPSMRTVGSGRRADLVRMRARSSPHFAQDPDQPMGNSYQFRRSITLATRSRRRVERHQRQNAVLTPLVFHNAAQGAPSNGQPGCPGRQGGRAGGHAGRAGRGRAGRGKGGVGRADRQAAGKASGRAEQAGRASGQSERAGRADSRAGRPGKRGKQQRRDDASRADASRQPGE
jgi:hypothetical protein